MKNVDNILDSWHITWTESGEILVRKNGMLKVSSRAAYALKPAPLALIGSWIQRIPALLGVPVLVPQYEREARVYAANN